MKKAILLLALAACSRRAEIEDAPAPGPIATAQVPKPDGGVPAVGDAILDHPEGLACDERPRSALCGGANDFGCDFDGWFQRVAVDCQQHTGCHTNGWLEAATDAQGCVVELRMEDADPEMVACLSAELRLYQCPCSSVEGSIYLGLANDGCVDDGCGTGELRCPPGSACQDGVCVEESTAGGAEGG